MAFSSGIDSVARSIASTIKLNLSGFARIASISAITLLWKASRASSGSSITEMPKNGRGTVITLSTDSCRCSIPIACCRTPINLMKSSRSCWSDVPSAGENNRCGTTCGRKIIRPVSATAWRWHLGQVVRFSFSCCSCIRRSGRSLISTICQAGEAKWC